MDDDLTDDEILSKLKRHRENILLVLYRHGELRTREIREEVGFPSGSKEHHLGILEEWGLIEEVGRVNESGGIPERVFGLTNTGREFVDDYLTEERERPGSYEMRIERLEDEVDDLQTTNERLEAKVDQQQEHLEDLEDRFDILLDRLEEQLF